MRTANHLANETSPYLLQHAYNPVAWYPWGDSAFEKAKKEDKPIFLSIGYSTCHWCHVMENESFEDDEVAAFLNDNFVSVKVDREERPDIDSVYMSVCTALTGGGGWPLTVIMTPDGKPFFAGTYFPKTSKYGRVGLLELMQNIQDLWQNRRGDIDKSAQDIVAAIQKSEKSAVAGGFSTDSFSDGVVKKTYRFLSSAFDDVYGGFGAAPKFPAAHNLLFLLEYYGINKDENALLMAEKTLISMYKGGIFDHIGYGFCRYSTDRFWLVPHFEKMLYDNALLLAAYVKAYSTTKKEIYKTIAERIVEYVLREMTDACGGFYSAQDADVSGEEGKYYAFSLSEITDVLGEKDGSEFAKRHGITDKGNFEGKNIPNLIKNDDIDVGVNDKESIVKLYKYRKNRFELKTDDKILTSWNCLMIAALADASVAFGNPDYLVAAKNAFHFINRNLKSGNGLFASYRGGKHSGQGFLDDYAFYVYACICLYKAELDEKYIKSALETTEKIIGGFSAEDGGFYLSSNEELIFRPVEVYDGAMPCGNSVMCYNLIYLSAFTGDKKLYDLCDSQINFMLSKTSFFSGGASFFALSQLKSDNLSKVVCVPENDHDLIEMTDLTDRLKQFDIVKILSKPSADYPLKDNKTTYYLCRGNTCFPPQNDLILR